MYYVHIYILHQKNHTSTASWHCPDAKAWILSVDSHEFIGVLWMCHQIAHCGHKLHHRNHGSTVYGLIVLQYLDQKYRSSWILRFLTQSHAKLPIKAFTSMATDCATKIMDPILCGATMAQKYGSEAGIFRSHQQMCVESPTNYIPQPKQQIALQKSWAHLLMAPPGFKNIALNHQILMDPQNFRSIY